MEALIPLIIQLASGALGGNIAGSLLKKFSLGTLGNSLVGILGGGLGGQLLGLLGISTGAGSMDVAGIIGSIASGGVGGGVLMALIGVIRQALNK
ncbi:MAG: GlsB/YeaQ/YmgE family stress response membrane protein [Sedimenticola sp.]